ncbi:hypothetical protein [Ralstonia pseudosolanacearum]|uniref:hypothetical protein n=1 Tax=Ralstonia pseudosolanacearum TaxID=1310165 RepID=UPI001FFBCD2F|nr:hypothetical protein [Ralstonia pseudosolanacearum]
MATSLLRSLAASIRLNISTVQREAKRLHKASPEVFGQDYPLSTCQKAVARAKGFSSWEELRKVAARFGVDRTLPFWYVHSRNDYHEAIVEALFSVELDSSENGPVVFLGDAKEAAPVALTMLIEEMSRRRVPGLILIETDAQTVQDTDLQRAAAQLGLEETLSAFRTVDLRERNLQVAISASTRYWIESIVHLLPYEDKQALSESGWSRVVEVVADAFARNRGASEDGLVDFYPVEQAIYAMGSARYYPSVLSDEQRNLLEMEDKSPPQIPKDIRDRIFNVAGELRERKFGVGWSLQHETKHRPLITLFSRDDLASVALAGAVHSLFYWRYVNDRATRPILFYSDKARPYAPHFLTFGTHTLVANGLSEDIPVGQQDWYGYRCAFRAIATPSSLQFAGRRVEFK